MRYEMLVGLNVIDDATYEDYRRQMKPILSRYGGAFGYDFQVSKVLISEQDTPMNRVFTIYFRDEDAMNEFFSDLEYREVRETFYSKSVEESTIIAKYQRSTAE